MPPSTVSENTVPFAFNPIYGNPAWYHHHGDKMKLEALDVKNKKLVVAGSASELTITRLE